MTGATFRCGHPRTPENTEKWGASKRRNFAGSDVCALCYRAKRIVRQVDEHIERNRHPERLTRGQRVCAGLG